MSGCWATGGVGGAVYVYESGYEEFNIEEIT